MPIADAASTPVCKDALVTRSFPLSNSVRVWLVAGFVGVMTFAVHIRSLFHDFVGLDDPQYVTQNIHVCGGLTWAGLHWAWTTHHAANWHPLVWMSLMLDRSLFGPAPWGHHLTNILLHAVNSTVLFLALQRMTCHAFARLLPPCCSRSIPCASNPSHGWRKERMSCLDCFGF